MIFLISTKMHYEFERKKKKYNRLGMYSWLKHIYSVTKLSLVAISSSSKRKHNSVNICYVVLFE